MSSFFNIKTGQILNFKMMTKNKILNSVIDKLMDQRGELNNELSNINYNEAMYEQKKMTLENAIINLDTAIDRRVMDIEHTPLTNFKK